MTIVRALVWLALASAPVAALAQSSASYMISDHAFNCGGGPRGFLVPTSASYQITLDSIGEMVTGTSLAGGSFRLEGSLASAHRPPGEVLGLDFTDDTTLEWDAEPSIGEYQVYRDHLSLLTGGSTGVCLWWNVTAPIAVDSASPVAGQAYFYLVTARNRLDEEGTKGFRSDGWERPNPAPCP